MKTKRLFYTLLQHYKAFTSELGLDAMSLAWRAVVQLVFFLLTLARSG